MPMPKPKAGETQDEFLARCMADQIMVEDYADDDQRFAVCESQWKEGRSMGETEIRTIAVDDLRAGAGEDGKPTVSGRAILYNALSDDLGGFREQFAPGSVELAPDLLVLFDHQTAKVLGRTSAGTAEVAEDKQGVTMRAWPPATTWAADLLESMGRGDIRHMSFRFAAVSDSVRYDRKTDTVIRTVTKARVSELSIVSMPAYPQTSSEIRERAEAVRSAARATEVAAAPAGEDREGRVLSNSNYSKIGQAADLLTEVLAAAGPKDAAGGEQDRQGEAGEIAEAVADTIAETDAEGGSPEGSSPEPGGSPETDPETFVPGFGFVTTKGE